MSTRMVLENIMRMTMKVVEIIIGIDDNEAGFATVELTQ